MCSSDLVTDSEACSTTCGMLETNKSDCEICEKITHCCRSNLLSSEGGVSAAAGGVGDDIPDSKATANDKMYVPSTTCLKYLLPT